MLILAVKEPAEKKQLSCGSLCCSKQTIKAHIFGPFLTYTLLFVKGCFFSDLTYLPHRIQWKHWSPIQTHPSAQKRSGRESFSPPFFRGGGICKRIFSKTLFTVSGHFCKRSAIVFVFLWADENELWHFRRGWSSWYITKCMPCKACNRISI